MPFLKRKVPFCMVDNNIGMPFWKIRDCGWMIVGKTFCKFSVFHYNSLHLRLLDGVFLPLAIFTLIWIGAWITDTHYLTISKTIALYSHRKWIYLKVPFFYEKVPLKAKAPPPNFNLLLTPLNIALKKSHPICFISRDTWWLVLLRCIPNKIKQSVSIDNSK